MYYLSQLFSYIKLIETIQNCFNIPGDYQKNYAGRFNMIILQRRLIN